MAIQDITQGRFIELLVELTMGRKLEWLRSKSEYGFVYCWSGVDLIVFEIRFRDDIADPEGDVSGIIGKCRNVSYLWLQPTPGFGELLELMRKAPVDDEKFVELRRRAFLTPIQALESLLK